MAQLRFPWWGKRAVSKPVEMIGSLLMTVIIVVVIVSFVFVFLLSNPAASGASSIARDVLDSMCGMDGSFERAQTIELAHVSGDTNKLTTRYYYYAIWLDGSKVYVDVYSVGDEVGSAEAKDGFAEWNPIFDERGNVPGAKRVARYEAKGCEGMTLCFNDASSCGKSVYFATSASSDVVDFRVTKTNEKLVVVRD